MDHPPPAAEHEFVRGDVNGDGRVNMPDALAILSFLFDGSTSPDERFLAAARGPVRRVGRWLVPRPTGTGPPA